MKIEESVKIFLGIVLKAHETQTHLKLPGKGQLASAHQESTSLNSQCIAYSHSAPRVELVINLMR